MEGFQGLIGVVRFRALEPKAPSPPANHCERRAPIIVAVGLDPGPQGDKLCPRLPGLGVTAT